MNWLPAWRYSDEALAAFGNPGLLRRAARLVEAGALAWLEQGADRARLRCEAHELRLDGAGLARARCSCPAPGVCAHLLAAALWLRGSAGLAPADNGEEQEPGAGGAAAAGDGAADGGAAEPVEPQAQEPESQLQPEAVIPDLELLQALQAEVEQLCNSGLAHLGAPHAARLRALAQLARASAWPRLAGRVRELAGLVQALVAGAEPVDTSLLLRHCAELWLWCHAACHGGLPETPLRRAFEAPVELDLLAVGAHWWQQPSGARGLSLVLLDLDSGRLLQQVAARPDHGDPAFDRHWAWHQQPLWNGAGTPQAVVAAGRLQLQQARLSADLRLSGSGPGQARLGPPLALADPRWRAAAINDWQQLEQALRAATRLFPEPGELWLLQPRACQAPWLDELRQQLVWPLQDAAGRVLPLRLPCRPDRAGRLAALQRLHDQVPAAVLVQAHAEPEPWLEPLSLLVAEQQELRCIALDFAPVPAGKPGPLASRVQRLLAARARAELPPPAALQSPFDALLAVLEAQASSGRRQPAASALAILQAQSLRLRSLGLDTLGAALAAYLAAPGAAGLLQLVALVGLLQRLGLRLA